MWTLQVSSKCRPSTLLPHRIEPRNYERPSQIHGDSMISLTLGLFLLASGAWIVQGVLSAGNLKTNLVQNAQCLLSG